MEKFIYGQFNLPSEKARAEKEGNLAEKEKEAKDATGRLREKQAEKAIKETEEALKKELGK